MKSECAEVPLCDVSVSGSFCGGNPQSTSNIKATGTNCFLIFPECESDSPAYKFRFDVEFYNKSNQQVPVILSLDWQDSSYGLLRTGLYCSDENNTTEWRYVPGVIQTDGRITFAIYLNPGVTKVSASPRYDQVDLNKLTEYSQGVQNIQVDTFSSEELIDPVCSFFICRQSLEKRPLILVIARCHPYETAGSFCLDGVVRKFVNDVYWRNMMLEKYNYYLIPVLSVNGVSRGYCRFDGVGEPGIDLGRQWSDGEAICEIIRGIVERHSVTGYLELHNWMHPDRDGIMYADFWSCRRFVKKLNSYDVATKKFRTRFRYGMFSAKTYGVLSWVKRNSKASCLAVEYPWYGRSVNQMRDLGVATLETFVALL